MSASEGARCRIELSIMSVTCRRFLRIAVVRLAAWDHTFALIERCLDLDRDEIIGVALALAE
jgi:hypothetical protein